MKNQKQRKIRSKNKLPELTAEEIKKLLLEAGFVFINDKKQGFGKPQSELHQGETVIYPEGSSRGFKVK